MEIEKKFPSKTKSLIYVLFSYDKQGKVLFKSFKNDP